MRVVSEWRRLSLSLKIAIGRAVFIISIHFSEFEKEELLRNVFRKARQKAKDELAAQLSEFQVKRQVGLASLYGPDDSVIDKCDVDKIQVIK